MKKTLRKVASFLFLPLVLAACGGGGGDAVSTAFGGDTVTGNVGPAGGTIATPSGNVTLNVPPGALDNVVSITIRESNLSGDIGAIGQIYDFGPDGLRFKTPVHMKLKYDPSSIPSGINETDLQLASFSANGWELIGSLVLDKTNHVLEGDIVHFSPYGLAYRNTYPITLVKETDFAGNLAQSFRIPVGDDGVTDSGNDVSLLSIDNFTNFQYPKIRFNNASPSNRWYVSVAFNVNRWLNNGWSNEPSLNDASYYDNRWYHPGEDWNITTGGNTDEGKLVHAVANGIVLFNGWKWGNTIILGHKLSSGEIIASLYAHLQERPNLSVTQTVIKGEVIGKVGQTGTDGGSHLHFELAKGIGADGTSYMLKKTAAGEIVFANEGSILDPITGLKIYSYLWNWPGTDNAFIESNWYNPSLFIKNYSTYNGLKSFIVMLSEAVNAGNRQDILNLMSDEFQWAMDPMKVSKEAALTLMDQYNMWGYFQSALNNEPIYFEDSFYPDGCYSVWVNNNYNQPIGFIFYNLGGVWKWVELRAD